MVPYEYMGRGLGLTYIAKLGIVAIHALVSSCLLFSKQRHSRPGSSQRLFLALLITTVNCMLPVLFNPVSEVVTTAVVGLSCFWLASLKASSFLKKERMKNEVFYRKNTI